jgi:hypothetical protein
MKPLAPGGRADEILTALESLLGQPLIETLVK